MVRTAPVHASFLAVAFLALHLQPVNAQTFIDRQSDDSFRMVSYNVYWDTLFQAPDELSRLVSAVDADVYNFQELSETSAFEVRERFNELAPIGGSGWQVHKARNQVIVSRYDLSLQETNVPGGQRGIAMAQVDLPDEHFSNDLFLLNNHFPCCDNESGRIIEADAISDWIQDGISPGGNFDLEPGTAISVLGDLNIVNGPAPLDILLDGRNGVSPDWDGTSLADANPSHNAENEDYWTWRNDRSGFDPGILDYILYTDSVLELDHAFVLNPTQMSNPELAASGLQATDFLLNQDQPWRNVFDHLPLVVDFVGTPSLEGDFDQDGDVDVDDIDFYSGQIGLEATGALAQLDLDQDEWVTLADLQLHVSSLVQTSSGIRGTFAGDANLDGAVDVTNDAASLINALVTDGLKSWSDGDFNADGQVDVLADAAVLITNLGNRHLPNAGAIQINAVPEPNANSLLLGVTCAVALLARRRM